MTQIQAEYFDVPLSARSITSVQQNNHGVISATKAKQYTIREGTFFLGEGGLGPQRGGSTVKVSTKRGGPYLM